MLRLIIAVLFLTAGCGRTEPVKGWQPPIEVPLEHPAADAGVELINAGACEGPANACPRGFHCEAGVCVLNGDEGELQVTLQWKNLPRTNDDLDLHLLEPLSGGGSCEIYFASGGFFSCQAVGNLDLDANGACMDTDPTGGPGADTENIIYPPGRAVPRGHYVVRVDYWGECGTAVTVPFEVIVRKGATVLKRSGLFRQGESDSGEAGSGVTVLEFDVP